MTVTLAENVQMYTQRVREFHSFYSLHGMQSIAINVLDLLFKCI